MVAITDTYIFLAFVKIIILFALFFFFFFIYDRKKTWSEFPFMCSIGGLILIELFQAFILFL